MTREAGVSAVARDPGPADEPVQLHVNPRRPDKLGRPLRRRPVDLVRSRLTFLYALVETGPLEIWIPRRLCGPRDCDLVVESPPPFGVAAEEVVNQTLDDLAECQEPSRYRIFEWVLPSWP